MSALPGSLAVIGSTPVVRLPRLVEPGMAEVRVKLESHNPPGARIATVAVDGGMKYLSGELYA
jgi:cysteine synthase